MASGRVLALDVGRKRTGVALSDALGITARPLTVLPRASDEADAATVARLVHDNDARRVVVGLPLLPSGDRGEEAQLVEQFAATLRATLAVPVELWDESFSTLEAARRRTERGARGSTDLDADAAAVILEEWLAEQALHDAGDAS